MFLLTKRLLDILISASGLVLLLPLFFLIALMVRIFLGSPVLFRQQRPGLKGRPFELLKFRSMLDATDSEGTPLPDQERMTGFGCFLRKWSLDELPELLNVLRGEMSLVGPRPLLMEYLSLYNDEQARRHDVRPGLTGWAQVNGRNLVSWPEKFEMDVWYVENASMSLDIKIMAQTIGVVLGRRGIAGDNHVTASPFSGNVEVRERCEGCDNKSKASDA